MKSNSIILQAIKREAGLGKYLLHNYISLLKSFEKKYGMKTASFIKLFENGKLGDEQDYFEWFSLSEAKKHWEEKLTKLHTA